MSVRRVRKKTELQQPQGLDARTQIQKDLEPFTYHLDRFRSDLGSAFDAFLSSLKDEYFQPDSIASSRSDKFELSAPSKLGTLFESGSAHSSVADQGLLTAAHEESNNTLAIPVRGKSISYAVSTAEVTGDLLAEALNANGLAEFASAFVKQDVTDIAIAKSLSLEELRMVMDTQNKRPTVGAVRNCHRVLADFASKSQHLRNSLSPTPESVLPRSLLNLSPMDLKQALNSRINAETIFASLMLTIAATALMDTPLEKICDSEYGVPSCDALRCAYLSVWGIACGGFAMACLVSLGSMQIVFGGACPGDVHARYIGGETYFHLSHNFISIGLVNGLLPGLCLNMFLRFPRFCWTCGLLSIFIWVLWALQMCRGCQSIWSIYGDFPGFGSMLKFFQGYIAFGKTITLKSGLEEQKRNFVRCSVASSFHDGQSNPTNMEILGKCF